MTDLLELYDEAIEVCEMWRNRTLVTKATPNELHIYNTFTQAKRELEQQLACINDIIKRSNNVLTTK